MEAGNNEKPACSDLSPGLIILGMAPSQVAKSSQSTNMMIGDRPLTTSTTWNSKNLVSILSPSSSMMLPSGKRPLVVPQLTTPPGLASGQVLTTPPGLASGQVLTPRPGLASGQVLTTPPGLASGQGLVPPTGLVSAAEGLAPPKVQVKGGKKVTDKRHCCVPFCTNNGSKGLGIAFHRFPKSKERRKQWGQKIRRMAGPKYNFEINDTTLICGAHFTPDDYKWAPNMKSLLKTTAVPSQFAWSEEVKKRRPLVRHMETSLSAEVMEVDPVEEETPMLDESAPVVVDNTLPPEDMVAILNKQVQELQKQLAQKEDENTMLKQKLELERFGISRFSHDPTLVLYYTGFTSYRVFIAFFEWVRPSAQKMISKYNQRHGEYPDLSLAGAPRSMQLIDELFMFLCRLRGGLQVQDLAVRFNTSTSTVSRKVISWANYLYIILGRIPIWLKREIIQELMPSETKRRFPNLRVIIDCTEIELQRPSSLKANSQCHSNYKGRPTMKFLVGCAPHGALTYISEAWSGSISDNEITKQCKLKKLLEPGDEVMADKGFTLFEHIEQAHGKLRVPNFLRAKTQFTPEEVEQNEEISAIRIHIERYIRRIKEYRLFEGAFPINLTGTATQLWSVAGVLSLFQGPLIKEKEPKKTG